MKFSDDRRWSDLLKGLKVENKLIFFERKFRWKGKFRTTNHRNWSSFVNFARKPFSIICLTHFDSAWNDNSAWNFILCLTPRGSGSKMKERNIEEIAFCVFDPNGYDSTLTSGGERNLITDLGVYRDRILLSFRSEGGISCRLRDDFVWGIK